MIGNDIIDIERTLLETDWQRKGFIQKVFHPDEQELIHSSDDPFGLVWRMWSMKESAYKLFLQTGQDRFFNPLRLRCMISSSEEGFVKIEELQIYTRSKSDPDFIFTSASPNYADEPVDNVFNLTKTDTHFQSKFTHRQLLKSIARKTNLNLRRLNVRKTDQNVPEVFYDGQKLGISVSLTHHGDYGAYSWIRPIVV